VKRIFGEIPGRIIGIAAAVAVIVLLILTVQVLIIPVVGAIFLAYLLEPGVVALQRRGMRRGNAFIVVLACLTPCSWHRYCCLDRSLLRRQMV
jgi:predicted PurR-regulated permease PerM